MRIEINKERVFEAARSCPQAKQVLKILFPELFAEAEYPYQQLLKPGTRWQHDKGGIVYTYLGDSAELRERLRLPHPNSFYSFGEDGNFVHTNKNVNDIQVCKQ